MQKVIGNLAIEKFFRDYESVFNKSLSGDPDIEGTADCFNDCFLAAGPTSAVCGRNDDKFRKSVAEGYKIYRASGLRSMKIESASQVQVDKLHVINTIRWRASYEKDTKNKDIFFEVSYLVDITAHGPKIICYITGDEEAELKKQGILPATKSSSFHYQDRFVVSTGKEMKMMGATEIAYFFTENKMVYLVALTGEKSGTGYTLEQLEQMLDPKCFFRINRKFIVNVAAITHLSNASKSRIKLSLQPECRYDTTTSFKRTAIFKKWLAGVR